jgi:hypothetical protein
MEFTRPQGVIRNIKILKDYVHNMYQGDIVNYGQ